MKQLFLWLYRQIFYHAWLYPLNQHLYKISLRGIGVLNSEGEDVTGESYLLKKLSAQSQIKTVIDVGANIGTYTRMLQKAFPKATVYGLEPHPLTFKKLQKNTKRSKIKIFNIGLAKKSGKGKLYDFANDATLKSTQPTSTLASRYPQVITQLHQQKKQFFPITLQTLDRFAQQQKITRIDLLQIDTEGSELSVLEGAKALIKKQAVGIVQFEFNEMNVYSRTFLKDFMDILPNHRFYRIMKDGLILLEPYQPKIHEIFAFQNIVAIPKEMKF